MDFNATIDLIIKDLNEASDIIDDLKKYPGVPALQVELAKSKCRSAGDVIALLKSIKELVPPITETDHEKQLSNAQTKAFVQGEVIKAEPLPKEKKKDPVAPVNPSPPVEVKAEPDDNDKKPAEAISVADKYSPTLDLYEEQVSSLKIEKDLSDRLKEKQIASLSEAIGISDKFLFMGEIFNGNKEAYSQAITRLDKVESLTDARAIIMSYTGENAENEAVNQLLELVKLKLGSDE
jgi:copper chaperone CopZ